MATIYAITDSIIEKIQKADLTAERGYRSGVSNLDKIFRIDKKQLTIITGKANQGKTTFLDYYTYMLAKNAGLKTLFLSFETDINLHLALLLKYADKEILKSKLYFADTTEISTIEQIIKVIIDAKENYNIDNIVIDPFNYISTEQAIDTNAICYILKELRQAAKKYNVSVILVAHPRKMQADEQLTGESIAGSIHFSTVADNILIISTDFNTHKTTVRTDKIRYNKMQGEINSTADFLYCLDGTYIENTEDELFGTVAHVQQPKPNKQPKPQEAQRIEIAKAVLQETESKIDYNKLMQTKVAYMDNVCAKQSDAITLQDALSKADGIQDKQAELRTLTDKTEIQKYKRNNFPAFAPSVVFNSDGTSKDNVKQVNPIVCIDIDGQDNGYMPTNKMKDIVSKIDSVFYAQESAGGKGIFCLIQVSDANKFKEHFNALQEAFKSKGLIIDEQCSDINRKRFVAYDPNPYINRNATIYKDIKEDITIQHNAQDTTTTPFYRSDMSDKTHQPSWPNGWSNYTDVQKAEYIINQCITKGILINKSHADSLTIASALKTIYKDDSDTGLNYCLQLRQMRKGTDITKQTYMYQNATEKTYAVGCLVNLYKNAIIAQN